MNHASKAYSALDNDLRQLLTLRVWYAALTQQLLRIFTVGDAVSHMVVCLNYSTTPHIAHALTQFIHTLHASIAVFTYAPHGVIRGVGNVRAQLVPIDRVRYIWHVQVREAAKPFLKLGTATPCTTVAVCFCIRTVVVYVVKAVSYAMCYGVQARVDRM